MAQFHFHTLVYAFILYFLRLATWNDSLVIYVCIQMFLLEYHLNCCIHIRDLLHFKPYVISVITICQVIIYILIMRRHNRTNEITLIWLTEAGKWEYEIVNIEQHHFQRQSSLIILLCFTMSQICFYQDIQVNK